LILNVFFYSSPLIQESKGIFFILAPFLTKDNISEINEENGVWLIQGGRGLTLTLPNQTSMLVDLMKQAGGQLCDDRQRFGKTAGLKTFMFTVKTFVRDRDTPTEKLTIMFPQGIVCTSASFQGASLVEGDTSLQVEEVVAGPSSSIALVCEVKGKSEPTGAMKKGSTDPKDEFKRLQKARQAAAPLSDSSSDDDEESDDDGDDDEESDDDGDDDSNVGSSVKGLSDAMAGMKVSTGKILIHLYTLFATLFLHLFLRPLFLQARRWQSVRPLVLQARRWQSMQPLVLQARRGQSHQAVFALKFHLHLRLPPADHLFCHELQRFLSH